jgi:hypothetical protein
VEAQGLRTWNHSHFSVEVLQGSSAASCSRPGTDTPKVGNRRLASPCSTPVGTCIHLERGGVPCLLWVIALTKVLIHTTPCNPRFQESSDGDGPEGGVQERSATLWSSPASFLRRVVRLGWLVFQNGLTGGKHQKEIDRMLWASVAAGDEEGTKLALEQGGRATCKLLEVGPHDKIKDDTSCQTPLHLAAQM